MNSQFLLNPYIVFPFLLALGLAGYLLGRRALRESEEHILPIFMHELVLANRGKASSRQLLRVLLLQTAATLVLFLLWLIMQRMQSVLIFGLYLYFLGMLLALILITVLRSFETNLMAGVIKSRRTEIEGKLLLKKGYTLRQGAVQYLSIFLLLAMMFLIEGGAFYAGAASAPLALAIRNFAYAKS